MGDYTVGDSSYVRPPSKDGGDTVFYDSCVNNIHNPSIFVVFEKHQIYPEYLIQYSEVIPSYSTSPTYRYTQNSATVNRAAYGPPTQPPAVARAVTQLSATTIWPTSAAASTHQPAPAAASANKPTPTSYAYKPAPVSYSYEHTSKPKPKPKPDSCSMC